MSLNKNSKNSNMYSFVSHTFNTIKGACFHDCKFCYMKRWGKLNPVRFDEKELKTDLGKGNFIFVGSSCDMFAENIPSEWIKETLEHCGKFNNKYFFQTKNPKRIRCIFPENSNVCVSLESNRHYPEILNNSPAPIERVKEMQLIRHPLYITIEPILKFDLKEFVEMIASCNSIQVNIGLDSGNNKLPEPTKSEILELIEKLKEINVNVHLKSNLNRLIK